MDLDVLSDVLLLSPGLLICGLLLGFALWLFGWRWHRFWIVLAATVSAGVVGLAHGSSLHAQPLVAAGLLALAAGVLALALVRLLAFLVGGTAGILIVQTWSPQWNQPLVAFVASGLVGLFLFRWCWMAVTSSTGTLLLAYCGLGLGQHYRALEAMRWCEQTGDMLNWLLAGGAFLGLCFQLLLDRRTRRARRSDDDDEGEEELDAPGKRAFRWFRRAG